MTAKKTTEAPEQTEATPEGPTPYDVAVRESYAYASRVLREENENHFNTLRADYIKRAGFDGWEPASVIAKRKADEKKAAAEEKAANMLSKLLSEHPDLAHRLQQGTGGTEAQTEG